MASSSTTATARPNTYDHVVIAAHSDQALAMLSDADDRERAILGAIGYSPNTIYLHRDPALMPKRRRAWASWNFLRWPRQGHMQRRQRRLGDLLDERAAGHRSRQAAVRQPQPAGRARSRADLRQLLCEHPQYNAAAFAAQKRLPEIQGRRHTWFCGAWTGYGFHEDGLRSGLAVAEALGAVAPWRQRAARTGGSGGVAMAQPGSDQNDLAPPMPRRFTSATSCMRG